MKIYTKTGDRGKTSLFSGERVGKHHLRVEAYGDVDELNSAIGVVSATLTGEQVQNMDALKKVQKDLFLVGARLATTEVSPGPDAMDEISPSHIAWLEQAIDTMQKDLPELKEFILPGGCPASGASHLARAICRRAERHTVALAEIQESEGRDLLHTISYLNRLSDYLFVLARHCNWCEGIEDITWRR